MMGYKRREIAVDDEKGHRRRGRRHWFPCFALPCLYKQVMD